jgi:hypothetical protein
MSDLDDLSEVFQKISCRSSEIKVSPCRRESFLAHLRALASWEDEPLTSYPTDASAVFPDTLPIAFAVCHKDCGVREFIVEGSTQECQH